MSLLAGQLERGCANELATSLLAAYAAKCPQKSRFLSETQTRAPCSKLILKLLQQQHTGYSYSSAFSTAAFFRWRSAVVLYLNLGHLISVDACIFTSLWDADERLLQILTGVLFTDLLFNLSWLHFTL